LSLLDGVDCPDYRLPEPVAQFPGLWETRITAKCNRPHSRSKVK